MATNEIPGLLKYKDEEGNINLLLPITTIDNVDGMDEFEASLSETIKFTKQYLSDAQKAQARDNIGVNSVGNYDIVAGASVIEPGKYYAFGEVDSLEITLAEADETVANEYYFEFIPSNNFTGLSITSAIRWATPPQYPTGKTCQVSILRGIGVMACA